MAGTTNLNFTSGGFTLSAWVLYNDIPSEGVILAKHFGGYGNGFFLQVKGNAAAFFVNGDPRLVSADTANDAKWHQLGAVYEGSTQFLYVDGVLKGTRAMPYTVPNAASIEIGRVTSSAYFKGKIDDVRVYGRPLSTAEVTMLYASESGAASRISVSPASLDFGEVALGQTKNLAFAVRNASGGALIVNSITSDNARFAVISPTIPFNVATGAQQVVLVRFTPTVADSAGGNLSVTNNDPANGVVTVHVTGTGVTAPTPTALLSDSFDRPDADRCALGKSDPAFGGAHNHFCLSIFPTGGTDFSRPVGASIVSGALQNSGLDYGGIQFTASEGVCSNPSLRGETIGQDINIKVDLRVPSDAAGDISQAGPYLRSRLARAGDGIIGGADVDPSGGYWVQLHSTGEIKIKRLYPAATVAFTGRPVSFDASVFHGLEIATQGDELQVALDGRLQTSNQDGKLNTTVAIPNTGRGNQGAAGIALGAEDNRGKIGGQRADNLLITAFSPLTGLPVQDNFASAAPALTIQLVANKLVISWPEGFINAVLEVADSLAPQIQWNRVPAPPVVVGGRATVVLTPGQTQQFYRLAAGVAAPPASRPQAGLDLPDDWQPTFAVQGSSQATVSAALGGTVQLPGGATVRIPAGALTNDTKITFTKLDLSQFSLGIARDVYRIDAGAVKLQQPALLELPIPRRSDTSSDIRVFRNSAEEGPQELPAQVNRPAGTVQVATDRFSYIAVEQDTRYLETFASVGSRSPSSILPVPYYWQGFTMWCFAASSQMMLKYYGVDVEMWDVARYFNLSLDEGAKIWRLWAGHYADFFKAFGVPVRETSGWLLAPRLNGYLIEQLDANRPVFVIVQNGVHALVVVGYDAGGVFVHDPSGYSIQYVSGRPPEADRLAVRYFNWMEWNLALFSKYLGPVTIALPLPVWTITLDGTPDPPNPPISLNLKSAELTDIGATDPYLEIQRPRLPVGAAVSRFLADGKQPLGYRFVPGPNFEPPANAANSDQLVLRVNLHNTASLTSSASLQASIDGRIIYTSPTPVMIGGRTTLQEVRLFEARSPYSFKTGVAGLFPPGKRELKIELLSGGRVVDSVPIQMEIGPARPVGLEKLKVAEGVKVRWTANPEEAFSQLRYGIYKYGIQISATDQKEFTDPAGPLEAEYRVVATHTMTDLRSPPSEPAQPAAGSPSPAPYVVPAISWKLSSYADDLVITNATGPTFSNTVAGVLYSAQGRTYINTSLHGTLQVSPVARDQNFDVTYTLTRQVQSPIPGVNSSSSVYLSATAPVNSGVVAANPETISLKLTFRPIPQTWLYKIDLTASPGFSGSGPGVTFIPADAPGGYSGNFSTSGDNSGISFGNGKISLGGLVYVGSDLSRFNPSYRLDVTVVFRSP